MTPMRLATEADFQPVITLLAASKLPHEDLHPASMQEFLVATEGQSALGVIGLERFGDIGLLRSLAVDAARRAAGIGGDLVDALERRSRDTGVRTLYLLTTTAADFFVRRGYAIVPRVQAPAALHATQEFSTLCPSQALCLRKLLDYSDSKTMTQKMYNVLFLCTGNSARSIMAEALVTTLGAGRFQGFSAGSKPGGTVNPFAIEQVEMMGYPAGQLRSKSWDEFAGPAAPRMDFIITVCDNAAGESCPFWPGHPATAHWGFEDPAAVEGTSHQKRAAFAAICAQIRKKVSAFVGLPAPLFYTPAINDEIRKLGELPV